MRGQFVIGIEREQLLISVLRPYGVARLELAKRQRVQCLGSDAALRSDGIILRPRLGVAFGAHVEVGRKFQRLGMIRLQRQRAV